MKLEEQVCSEDDCKEAVLAKGKCRKHYQQLRRGRLGKTRTHSPVGEAAEVSFRCHVDLKKAIKKQARAERRDPSELWREGGELLLRARALKAAKS